ncbi:hypothetical protein GJ698_28145 [Pseudoduganella sp. FT26W]|uniref:Uncharacterized protein n=1 Tax=Duganella aquatilis TaxID=2666082 RepID=A0A844DEV5_9BURK|nr:hypothetical protein [Duganella aquatilis]MRW87952.1 hypothetical protein [Duganella aquatilis]
MSTRKKNAEPPRQNKARPAMPPTSPCAIDIDALLTIGEERVHIVCEEDDNISFMSELIDTV